VLEKAAEWYALLRDGQASEQQRAAWQQWLGEADDHQSAWRYVEEISQGFAPLQETPNPRRISDQLQQANARLQRRRQLLTGMVGVAGTGLIGWLSWQHTPLPLALMAWSADHHTDVGEQRAITLADGSRIWLNTASAINTDLGPDLRRLILLDGEVFIDTASDAQRPFVMDTRYGRLRALGTRFNVQQTPTDTRLAVYQGAVEIRTHSDRRVQVVPAGQQARFTQNSITRNEPADNAREAWTRGQLLAEDIPLRHLVDELRRYRRGHIGLAAEIADMRVYGNFPLHDTDRVLTMLTAALPVEVKRTLPWWVSIEPRP